MTKPFPLFAVVLAFFSWPLAPEAVVLDGGNQCTVKLSDGTDVVLYGEYVSAIGGPSGGSNTGANTRPSRRIPVTDRDRLRRAATVRPAGGNINRVLGRDLSDEARTRFEQLRKNAAAPDFKEHKKSNRFYYLPPGNSLRLSTRPGEDTPEFLFVKYTTEETEAAGGVQGGLLHFLMEWSLTNNQEFDLRSKVAQRCRVDGKPGELVGNVEVDEADEKGSFRIISATLSDDGMRRSLVQSGHAPTMPGGKVAAAANLSKHGAQLFLATVEQSESIADLSVELDFSYVVQLPAAKGEIIFHWDRFRESVETFEKEYRDRLENTSTTVGHDWGFFKWEQTVSETGRSISESEAESLFDSMVEQGVVQFMFEGYQADSEYTQQIQKAMLDYFLGSMMKPADDAPAADFADQEPEGEENAGGQIPAGGEGSERVRYYEFERESVEAAFQAKKQVIRLDAGLAVRRNFQVVGNMASWYKSVRDNPKCVQLVNLNDPFFEHREIRFIVDLDAKEIFQEMVNYVTVNVRKRRSGDRTDFERSLTIDEKYLKDRGVAASLTYAREDDRNSELYEYQTQWSIRGGNLFPRRARWLRGNWEGVTLAPPIERWNIEVEGDLDQMLASDIARVTVELHYPLFGQEEFEVLPLSPRAGNWLVSDNIYVDRGTRGFAYRLIIHHKTEGRLVLPWQTRVGDRYVYATIPEEILVAGQPREQAKQLAKEIGKLGAEKVLDQFQELFSQAD